MSYAEFPIIRLKVLNTSTFSSSSNDAKNVNQSLLTLFQIENGVYDYNSAVFQIG
jgi:hypothetical protein